MADGSTGMESREESVGELARRLSELTTRLARQEVGLAKAELAAKGKSAGIGAGMFGAAAALLLLALGTLTAAAVMALDTAMAGWLAATIVGAVYLVLGGIVALVGKRRGAAATPPVPEQALASAKDDVQFAKQRAKEARER